MNQIDKVRIMNELIDGVKELNGEYQEGWDQVIEDGETLLKEMIKNK